VNRLLLIPAAALIAFGAEGLYHAFRGRDKVAIDCLDLTRQLPSSHRLLVTGCEIDFAGSGYRESGGQIQELFLPARPAGRSVAAPIVIATREPGAIAIAQSALGRGRAIAPEQSIAVMQKVADRVKAVGPIDGLARAGLIERFRSRRILSGLAAPMATHALLIDLGGTPDYWTPLLALGAGLLLGLLALGVRGRGNAPAVAAEAPPLPRALTLAEHPGTTAPIALPRMLLLRLDAEEGPDSIERAPALGSRRDVIAMLCGAIPELTVDDSRRILSRAGSIRIDLGAQDPVPTAVVDARGEAGAALVKEVLLMTGWRAFAPKTGLFVSIDELTAIGELAADNR
jgi:hypothetical protein